MANNEDDCPMVEALDNLAIMIYGTIQRGKTISWMGINCQIPALQSKHYI